MSLYRRGEWWWIDISSDQGRIREPAGTTDRKAAQEYHEKRKSEIWRRDKLGEAAPVTWGDAVKAWLREDTELLRRGLLNALPMGYLITGRIGTGKTFIVQCWAGELGVPCVVFKNFRDRWVGATESNLEKIFSVLLTVTWAGGAGTAGTTLVSRRHSRGSLSGRKPRKIGWRRPPSGRGGGHVPGSTDLR